MKHLPTAIISKIFNYTASPQPNPLLEDIRSFHNTKDFLVKFYKNNYDLPDFKVYDRLCFDIIGYINNGGARREEYFYMLWEKIEQRWCKNLLPAVYSAEYPSPPPNKKRPASWYRIDCYITRYFFLKTDNACFNIIWALLSFESRIDLIQKILENDELNIENLYD